MDLMQKLQDVQNNNGGVKATLLTVGSGLVSIGVGLITAGTIWQGVVVTLVGFGAFILREVIKV